VPATLLRDPVSETSCSVATPNSAFCRCDQKGTSSDASFEPEDTVDIHVRNVGFSPKCSNSVAAQKTELFRSPPLPPKLCRSQPLAYALCWAGGRCTGVWHPASYRGGHKERVGPLAKVRGSSSFWVVRPCYVLPHYLCLRGTS
jgi:hypothetical protein